MLDLVALDKGSVDRGSEGGIVELEREVLGACLAGDAAPAGSELDTAGGHPEVGGAVAGLDAVLDVEGEGLDGAGVCAGFVAGEGADLSHCRIS